MIGTTCLTFHKLFMVRARSVLVPPSTIVSLCGFLSKPPDGARGSLFYPWLHNGRILYRIDK